MFMKLFIVAVINIAQALCRGRLLFGVYDLMFYLDLRLSKDYFWERRKKYSCTPAAARI
jgi:hypothetical protein